MTSRTSKLLFRQQFRRDLRAGRFTMEFAQSAPRRAAMHHRCGRRVADPDPVRHQHAGNERAGAAAEGQGRAAGRAGHHDHRLWRCGDQAQGAGETAPRRCSPSRSTFATLRSEIDTRVGRGRMTARILVVDDEPDLEALVQQKFRHQIRDGSGQLSVRPRRRRGPDRAGGRITTSIWWSPTSTCRAWTG